MRLNRTRALMARKLEEKAFDTFALRVRLRGDEAALYSDNANGDTLFDIASCGKVLHTTPLVLQAIGESKLALDSTLDDFFAHVPEEKKRITVQQLLTHTSGIVRIPLLREVCAQGTDAIAAAILAAPLAFAPGSDYTYSCNGMNLLGFIVEKIYGHTMEKLFETRIKQPLGMTRSCFKIALDEPNAAVCYTRREAGGVCFDDINVCAMGRVCGAGGSFFSLGDVCRYIKAVQNRDERLYPASLYNLAEVDYAPACSAEGRGLGWLITDSRYPQTGRLFPAGSFGHCGHTGQSFFVNRPLDLSVIILSNATRFSAMKHDFVTDDYDTVMALRADIHNALCDDLVQEGFLTR